MPTYDYQCRACGHSLEATQSMKDDPLSVCPVCEQHELRRIITGGSGIIFRGSGFYVNDSRKGGQAGEAAAASASSGEGSSGKTADSGSSKTSGSGSGSSDGGPAKSA